jgi:hypothetical protein
MRESVRWPIVIVAGLLILSLVIFARGGDGEQRGRAVQEPSITVIVAAGAEDGAV